MRQTSKACRNPQDLIDLPTFRTSFAKSQYETEVQMIAPEERGVSRWPEVAQYLLRNYDQSTHIAVAIIYLRKIWKSHSKSENDLAKRINDAFQR